MGHRILLACIACGTFVAACTREPEPAAPAPVRTPDPGPGAPEHSAPEHRRA